MKNKKYGLIVFNKTQNLGDDIQSYAAIQYLPQIDYYIERECLNEFTSQKGEIVNVIMNGWYMHDITSMPPSPFINPLFISTHFTDHLYNECPEYLSGYFLKYLKKHEPIGCRDEVIRKYLTDNNIKNYWSGCLTLTIKKFPNIRKENYICAVDLDDEELSHLRKITNNEIRIITHKLDDNINSKLSYQERMQNVEKILKIYQGASLVITTRLHCALPSLALETPVIMIHDNNDIDKINRIGVFLQMTNYTSKDNFITGEFDYLIEKPKNNPNKYLDVRNKIEPIVNKFINNGCKEYSENEQNVELYKKYFIEQKEYIVNIMKQSSDKALKLNSKEFNNYHQQSIFEMNKSNRESVAEINKLSQKREYELNRQLNKYMLREETVNKELEVAISNYQKTIDKKQQEINILNQQLMIITTSKGYRYLEKFRKIKRKLFRRGK